MNDRIKKGLDLERNRVAAADSEIRTKAAQETAALRTDAQRRGVFHSGMHIAGQIKIQTQRLEELKNRWIVIRRELVRSIPELGSADQIAQLRQEIGQVLEAQWAHVADTVRRSVPGASDADIERILGSGEYADTLLRLKSETERDLRILEGEVGLGMHAPAKPASSITVNIKDSTVAGLNLGTVMGDLNAAVQSIHEAGNAQLAKILKDLIERVAADADLGEERRDAIESLTVISEEAALPADQRRPGMVRRLMSGLGPLLTRTAELAQIWQVAGPMIAAHFGFPTP